MSDTPTWSVMIPVYNRTDHLRQCLESVLASGAPAGRMQIAVVDDSTANPNVEAEVRAIPLARDRVEYHRNEKNLGMAGNWNRCIALARGELIHILHDDDYVSPEFYDRMESLARRFPSASVYFSRVLQVNSKGSPEWLSPRLEGLETSGRNPGRLLYRCDVRFPGVVARRDAYLRVGNFREDLHMILDWEMWLRLIREGGAASLDDLLAHYRLHDTNATHRLIRDGTYFREMLEIRPFLQSAFPEFRQEQFDGLLETDLRAFLRKSLEAGDKTAKDANMPHWRALVPWHRRARYVVRSLLEVMIRFLRV